MAGRAFAWGGRQKALSQPVHACGLMGELPSADRHSSSQSGRRNALVQTTHTVKFNGGTG